MKNIKKGAKATLDTLLTGVTGASTAIFAATTVALPIGYMGALWNSQNDGSLVLGIPLVIGFTALSGYITAGLSKATGYFYGRLCDDINYKHVQIEGII